MLLSLGCERKAPTERDQPTTDPVQMASPSSSTGVPPRPSGPHYEDDDFELIAETPSMCEETEPFVPGRGMKRLSVPIRVRATGDRPIPLSALAFRLVDRDGSFHGATLAGCAPALGTQTLSPGKKAKGSVAFDVPEEQVAFELQFEPFLIGRSGVQARVQVPPLESGSHPSSSPDD